MIGKGKYLTKVSKAHGGALYLEYNSGNFVSPILYMMYPSNV